MKSLLKLALFCGVIYFGWQWLSPSLFDGLKQLTGETMDGLSSVVHPGDVDFVAKYNVRVKKFTISSQHDRNLDVRSDLESLASYIHTPKSITPSVLVIYDGDELGNADQQAAFESRVRKLLAAVNARVRFAPQAP
jgi:hypothetical protein